MTSICLIGAVDKRVISYPLLKCLSLMGGKTLVITDDGVYRRFAQAYESRFEVGTIEFIVTPFIPKSIEELGVNPSNYDYVVYITTRELFECDSVVYCHGTERAIAPPKVLNKLEDIEHKDVTISMVGKVEKGMLQIGYSKEVMGYICNCEEYMEFVPCMGASFSVMMVTLFDDIFNMSKDNMKKLLGRKE